MVLGKIKGTIEVISDYFELKKQLRGNSDFPFGKFFPLVTDKYSEGGTAKGAYFHQDLYVARKIFENHPKKHVDIGSRIDGFVAHVATFREIEVFDIRPVISRVRNIFFKQADLMEPVDGLVDYADSISSLHAIEHFGLGRYGDPIDANGHEKGLNGIHSILKTGGFFYFSVPIGPQRIEFNAHRVFSIGWILNFFKARYELEEFSYVDDHGDFHENAELNEKNIQSNFDCQYGCGIFVLRKK